MRFSIFIMIAIIPLCISCQNRDSADDTPIITQTMNTDNSDTQDSDVINVESASITGVSISGSENNYSFAVTIESPDTGCTQYADWWEVFNEDGNLLYRRILAHSHVDEQPFTRSGGPINIDKNTNVFVRAHMNNLGYGTVLFSGSVENGFVETRQNQDFFSGLSDTDPLPSDCAF